jgi:hypothetical protein
MASTTNRRRRSGDTTSTGNTKSGNTTGKTVKSDNPEDDADPRRAFYNSLMRLQQKPPVKALMRKIPEDRPLEVAMSATRDELVLLLTPSGFQLRLGAELVGFFELPMYRAPRAGLEGFEYEAIHTVVMKRAER